MEEADKNWMMIRTVGGWVSVSSGTGSNISIFSNFCELSSI